MKEIVPIEKIERKIYVVRGRKVMLDSDLAELYGVPVKVLNQAVKRNSERFPEDFMFRLTKKEYDFLRSQIVTLKTGRGKHRKFLPNVFTEQGVAMLSSVLRSERAIKVNIAIMRAFVRVRRILSSHKELAKKLAQLEKKLTNHDGKLEKLDETVGGILTIIQELIEPTTQRERIGFRKTKSKDE